MPTRRLTDPFDSDLLNEESNISDYDVQLDDIDADSSDESDLAAVLAEGGAERAVDDVAELSLEDDEEDLDNELDDINLDDREYA